MTQTSDEDRARRECRPAAWGWPVQASLRGLLVAGLVVGLGEAEVAGEESPGSGEADREMARRLRELSLEELLEVRIGTVFAVSRHEQRLEEAPASVSIVTGDDIRKRGYLRLSEVLQGVRGFYTTYDRSYSYVGVRGVGRPGDYGGRVLVLIDGHRLNDPIYNEAFNGGEFPIDLALVERVEVVRGPGHTLYGDNAFLAVVNVIPKRGAQLGGVETSGTAASFDDYTGRLSYGTRTAGGLDVLISGTFRESAGQGALYFPEYAGSAAGGYARGLDGEGVKQLYTALSYEDFTVSWFFGERRKEVPTAQYEAVFDQGPNWVRDQRWGVGVKFDRTVGDDWRVFAKVAFDRYEFEGLGPYESWEPAFADPYIMNRDLAEATYWSAESEVSRTFFEQHRLALGAEVRQDVELRQRNWDYLEPAVLNLDTRNSAERFGIFLQDDYAVRTNVILSAAVRYDHFSTFGNTVNPRGSVVYQLDSRDTLKLLYAEAFRSPNAYELYYTVPGYRGNAELGPERGRSYELIWAREWDDVWRTEASLFLHDLRGFITPALDANGDYTFENLDRVISMGGEMEVTGRWDNGVRVRAAYTLAEVTEDRPGGGGERTPANSPTHLVKAGVTVPVYRDEVFATVEGVGMSERDTGAGDTVSGMATANFIVFGRALLPGLEVTAGVFNVFDHRYSDPVSTDIRGATVRQDGRTFRVRLTYRF